ncbi:MICOS complex subunit Mic10-like [Ciona intestinalis]
MSRIPTLGTENQYGEKVDKCIVDLGIKTGSGVLVGGLFSLLFKRKTWPITLGAGIGIGMSYTTCQNRFKSFINNKLESQNSAASTEEVTTTVDPTPDAPTQSEQSDSGTA